MFLAFTPYHSNVTYIYIEEREREGMGWMQWMSSDGLPPRLSYSMPPCFRHLDRSLKDRPILRPLSVRGM